MRAPHRQAGSGGESPAAELRRGADLLGNRSGGGAPPLASPNVAHWVGWLEVM